jgi:hypothetical protein
MVGIPSPLGGGDDDTFDRYDRYVPEHLPEPGSFLADHDVLTARDHLAFHRLTRVLFEARTVYDVTFGYNLARLNLDERHEDAGYRYAREADDPAVLRAEFTPTTAFCPQTHTLTLGSFRAWNGLAGRHEYDLVRVRADRSHHRADAINARLRAVEEAYLETGDLAAATERVDADAPADPPTDGGGAPQAPF